MGETERSALTDHLVAAAWGCAEATCFFVVPDVWTSRVALQRPRRGLATTLSALAGALAGGAAVHAWARRTPPATSARLMARIPAIDPAMIARVDADVAARGGRAIVTGPARGVPYKLCARSASLGGMPLTVLLAWTVPARIVRFAVVTAGVGALAAAARRAGLSTPRTEKLTHAAGWAAFYTWYFRTMRRRARRAAA